MNVLSFSQQLFSCLDRRLNLPVGLAVAWADGLMLEFPGL